MSKTNPRITKKERALLKGCIRRTFSRSELRRKILDAALIKDYQDPNRKRVTRWFKCSECQKLEPAYLGEVDHVEPLIPLDKAYEEMDLDEVVDRAWCPEENLKPMCKPCHKAKTKEENAERKRLKNEGTKK